MIINFSENFYQKVFTLTFSFIVLYASIEFVLIYRPHPVKYPTSLKTTSWELFLLVRQSSAVCKIQHQKYRQRLL
jgi:hypothetical protein